MKKVANDVYFDPTPFLARKVCQVTANRTTYDVLTFAKKRKGPWGFCEPKSSVKGRRPSLGYANYLPPVVQQQVFIHEFFHAWFQERLSEKEVDLLTKDFWRAMMTVDAARRKRAAKANKSNAERKAV